MFSEEELLPIKYKFGFSCDKYIGDESYDDKIYIDGKFNIDELREIADLMNEIINKRVK